ncbi:hypothetical protein D3C71_1330240 [compost metagenome]
MLRQLNFGNRPFLGRSIVNVFYGALMKQLQCLDIVRQSSLNLFWLQKRRAMAGRNCLRVPGLHPLQRLIPFLFITNDLIWIPDIRKGPDYEIAHIHDAVFRYIGYRSVVGLSFSMNQAEGFSSQLEGVLLIVSNVRIDEVRFLCEQVLPELKSVNGHVMGPELGVTVKPADDIPVTDDNRSLAFEYGGSAHMIGMTMRVDQITDWKAGQFANFSQNRFSSFRRYSGVKHHNALTGNDKANIAKAEVYSRIMALRQLIQFGFTSRHPVYLSLFYTVLGTKLRFLNECHSSSLLN